MSLFRIFESSRQRLPWYRRALERLAQRWAQPAHTRRCRPCLEILEDRQLLSAFLVTNTNDSGDGSLRQAIVSANSQAGPDAIDFDIGGTGVHSIALLSALPTITDPVLLDGTSQPGFSGTPLIELNGAGAGAAANGLTISAGASTVTGLAINRFSRDGIQITTIGGNLLTGNFVGTDPTGTSALGNGNDGVEIVGCSGNMVGGTASGMGNLLSGNSRNEVTVLGLSGTLATGNLVLGNKIGTDVAGSKALANAVAGVSLSNAAGNSVGGTPAGAGNQISGNAGDGIFISGSGATDNLVQGNKIGSNATDTAPLGNGTHGVEISGAVNNLVGGTAAGAGNLISGNAVGVFITGSGATGNLVQGNRIGTDFSSNPKLANGTGVVISAAANNTVGGTAAGAGNLVSGNTSAGVNLTNGAAGNVVQGNQVGTDLTGRGAVGNLNGVLINNAANNNTVGGTAAGAGNLLSGNIVAGVLIRDSGTTGNLVQGNRIGTDFTGTANVGNGSDGVQIIFSANNNTVGGTAAGAGNLISGNTLDGIFIGGSTGNLVQGNQIGTDLTGTDALANFRGVEIIGATANTVGGTAAGAGNLISGNARDGILIANSATGNLVQGNRIGTNAAGTAKLGNLVGVEINVATNNTVGGTAAGAGNLISGNINDGVNIFGSATTGNLVQGNQVGTDLTGTAALGNGTNGVVISGAANNTVGGTAAGAGNLISGNPFDGVLIKNSGATGNLVQGNKIGTDTTGTAVLGNGTYGVEISGVANITVGGTAAGAGNLISGNSIGVLIRNSGATGNLVQGNRIGTDTTGTAALGNGVGVDIISVSGNTIGGTAAGAGNLVSGNTGDGVFLFFGANSNLVQGNRIGTDLTGTAALGNGGNAVDIVNSPSNTVGGAAEGAGNLLSGNSGDGVLIVGAGAKGNLVQGNRIGTDVTGTAALGNGTNGVEIGVSAANNTVGGTAVEAGNVISANVQNGILITASGTTGNLVQGNRIGTNAVGTAKLGNGTGVVISAAANNTIGGTAAGAGNLVSGNTSAGIGIFNAGATGNVIQGNKVGTDAAGTANLGNGGAGVSVISASANAVGGSAPGAGNTIAFNGGAGVAVSISPSTHVPSTGNAIRSNAIFSNGGLGIDLRKDGVTINDVNDTDSGPNNLQNFPTLTAASSSIVRNSTSVGGTLNSTPNVTFTLEFFASSQADPSGFGEGQTFLGFSTVTTDASGNASFSVSFRPFTFIGNVITATATDPAGNTSEFSQAKVIGPRLATGTDAGDPPVVNVYDAPTGQLQFSFQPYPKSFHGGVRVAVGDVNGDGVPDIITAPGPGAALPVRVFDGDTGLQITGPLGSFFPFGPGFSRGMFVAVGAFDGDQKDDVVVSEDASGQPLVEVYSGANGAQLARF